MPFDLQAECNNQATNWGEVVIPAGLHLINQTVIIPEGVTLRGESKAGSILFGTVPGMDILYSHQANYYRTRNRLTNFCLASDESNVGGIHYKRSSANSFDNLLFRGVARTIHIDQGLGQEIHDIDVETLGSNKGGSLLFEASDANTYCQHVNFSNYRTYFDVNSAVMIMSRATNIVGTNITMHAPNNVGFIINNDSQGIQLSNMSMVGVTDGFLIYEQGGRTPIYITLNSINVDQATGYGGQIFNGGDVNILASGFTTCFQGLYVGAHPGVARVSVRNSSFNDMAANGIVIGGNGDYFNLTNNILAACSGAAIVVSPGTSTHYDISHNDVSQNNGAGVVIASSGTIQTVVKDNIG